MSKEKRKYQRISVKIPAYVYLKAEPKKGIEADILCISEGGAFVHCAAPIALGQEVFVEIRFSETQTIDGKVVDSDRYLRDLNAEIKNRSVVRWARGSSETGFGVEFIEVQRETRAFLKRLMEYFRQLAQVGVDFHGP